VQFAGILGEDAPDPRLEWIEQARQMPVPIIGLVPQPHLEDWGAIGVGTGTRNGVLDMCEVSVGYTLWRNPDEPDDPINLGEPNPALESEPPWPRPQWLIEQVRRMRYPMLWECVRTRWTREPDEFDTVPSQLTAHINHILVNRFEGAPAVDERSVESGISVVVDGVPRSGFRIDTDPYVYGVGVELDARALLTAAIPRDALSYVDVAFAARPA
jgi:hypothetical protein